MKDIKTNPTVGICGEWFTANGVAENMGYISNQGNRKIATKLRTAFSDWYSNGHTDESDINTIILCIRLTDAVLLSHGNKI
ncbi:MAG: hypothetical protein RRY79_06965 [Clostridia bacterium]